VECVELLNPLFETVFFNDKDQLSDLITSIYDLERDADDIKNELRENLPRTIFMPVSRPDFLVLLDVQDGMADTVQDIGVLLSVRIPQAVEGFKEDVIKLVDYAVTSARQVKTVYKSLNNLLESTFGGSPANDVLSRIEEIGETEHLADKTAYSLLHKLFNESETLPVQDFILWDKLLMKISHVADLARKTSNRLRIMLSH
jgi:predicted phosphate transport protein (TIGR00153 family)